MPYDLVRRLAPRYVADAVCNVLDLMPGHGLYRPDMVRVYGLFMLYAAESLSGSRMMGRQGTADALRRLADLVETGEVERASAEFFRGDT